MKKILRVLVVAALLIAIAIPCLAEEHTCDFSGTPVIVDSTCLQTGTMTYTCTVEGCDKTKVEIIAKKDHTWGDPEVGTPATCTKEGKMIQKCKTAGCTATKDAGIIEKTPHTFVKKHLEQAPKCGVDGWTSEEYCSTCNQRYDKVPVPATDKDHDWVREDVNSAKPCLEPSYSVLKCSVCNKIKDGSRIDKALDDHKPGSKTYLDKEAACETPETRYAICSVCGTRLPSEPVENTALQHDWKDYKVIVEPTCTEKGKAQETCSRCGKVRYGEVAVVAHKWGNYEVIKQPSCGVEGKAQETCEVGGEVRYGVIPALEHEYELVETKKAEKCTAGEKKEICKNCGDVKNVYVIEAPEAHDFAANVVIKAATCTEKGLKGTACKVCGVAKEGEKTEEIPALGHKAGEWQTVREASATREGKKVQYCTVCKALLGKKYIPATGSTSTKTSGKTIAFVKGEEVADYAKIDLSKDAITELDLVDAKGAKVGKLVVEVKEGTVTVKYELSAVPTEAFLTFVNEAPSKDITAEKAYEFEKAISVADERAGAAAAYIYVKIEF